MYTSLLLERINCRFTDKANNYISLFKGNLRSAVFVRSRPDLT